MKLRLNIGAIHPYPVQGHLGIIFTTLMEKEFATRIPKPDTSKLSSLSLAIDELAIFWEAFMSDTDKSPEVSVLTPLSVTAYEESKFTFKENKSDTIRGLTDTWKAFREKLAVELQSQFASLIREASVREKQKIISEVSAISRPELSVDELSGSINQLEAIVRDRNALDRRIRTVIVGSPQITSLIAKDSTENERIFARSNSEFEARDLSVVIGEVHSEINNRITILQGRLQEARCVAEAKRLEQEREAERVRRERAEAEAARARAEAAAREREAAAARSSYSSGGGFFGGSGYSSSPSYTSSSSGGGGWNAAAHPRGANGRFISKSSSSSTSSRGSGGGGGWNASAHPRGSDGRFVSKGGK